MKDNYIEKVLNENLLQDDFGKVYFLNEEAAIDFAEAYHAAKCSNIEPIGYVGEWEGDISDANNFIFLEKLDELDDSPNWIPVFAAPQSSDADEKLKLAREALQAILIGQTTKDYNLMLSTIGMATIAKQALEKIGE